MQRLWAAIQKDAQLLLRDKVGLILMFAMPIVLVLVITSLQNNTFKLVNSHQIPLVIFNEDHGEFGQELNRALATTGMFKIIIDSTTTGEKLQMQFIEKNDALAGLQLDTNFSSTVKFNAAFVAKNALAANAKTKETQQEKLPIKLYFSPVLQESYRMAIEGSVSTAVHQVQNREVLQTVFFALNKKEMPAETEALILNNRAKISGQTITAQGAGKIPNATQHNVPAWTIFAMFFMVVSLGSSLVREKRTGSFIRLKTMPGAYLHNIISKQIVYIVVGLLQVVVIFSLGVWLFPHIGLPQLELPHSMFALLLVSFFVAFCAVSYALVLGVFAQTEEQVNGFGAVSIVILAALGGILVPTFAMPQSFRILAAASPLHWCLDAFYALFLAQAKWADALQKLLPIIIFIGLLQVLAFVGLKRKNLI